VARGYLKPEEIHESQINGESSFNGEGNLVITALN
jgi:hypothetical protein